MSLSVELGALLSLGNCAKIYQRLGLHSKIQTNLETLSILSLVMTSLLRKLHFLNHCYEKPIDFFKFLSNFYFHVYRSVGHTTKKWPTFL